jgi:hypothetical protein
VVGEELEACGLDVGLEAVELNAISVVDEDILLLGNGKVRLVMEKTKDGDCGKLMGMGRQRVQYLRNVPACLLKLKLSVQSACLPVKSGNMTRLSDYCQVSAYII